jgi:hypothetical protein
LSEEGTGSLAIQNDGAIDLWIVTEAFLNLLGSQPVTTWRRGGKVGCEVHLHLESRIKRVDGVVPCWGDDDGKNVIRMIDEERRVRNIGDGGEDGATQVVPDDGNQTIVDNEIEKNDDGGEGIVSHEEGDGVVVTK